MILGFLIFKPKILPDTRVQFWIYKVSYRKFTRSPDSKFKRENLISYREGGEEEKLAPIHSKNKNTRVQYSVLTTFIFP
jgi:hypothetical protein